IDAVARHAQQELQKRGRGIRGSERQVETRDASAAAAIRGYGRAGRSAGAAAGRAPRGAAGLEWHRRVPPVAGRRGPGGGKRGGRANANDGSNGWIGG